MTTIVNQIHPKTIAPGEVKMSDIGYPGSEDVSWDDLRVPVQTIPELGVDTPPWKVWIDIPGTSVDFAIDFDGVNTGSVPDYAGLDVGNDMTVEMLVKLDDINGVLISRSGIWELRVDGGILTFELNGWDVDSGGSALITGAKYHIAVVCSNEGTRTRMKLYINGNEVGNRLRNTLIPAGTVGLDIAYDGVGSYVDGVMDELAIYNVPLTETQIIERFNAGGGSALLPTGITAATDVVGWFQFNENTGSTVDNNSTLGAGQDLTLTNSGLWTTGLVETGAAGLFLARRAFSPNVRQVIHFSIQLPHGYKYGTPLDLHVHWGKKDGVVGDVCWKALFSGAPLGSAFPVPSTVITGNSTAFSHDGAYVHLLTPLGAIPGTTFTSVSSMIDVVLWREPSDVTDTYPGDAFFNETDTHIQFDQTGSDQEYTK